VDRNAKVTVSTPQPTGHDFVISWSVNGKAVAQGRDSRTLDLSTVPNLPGKGTAGTQLACTVVDRTDAVRDEAAYRSSGTNRTYRWTLKP
jgi:hypothetical protein